MQKVDAEHLSSLHAQKNRFFFERFFFLLIQEEKRFFSHLKVLLSAKFSKKKKGTARKELQKRTAFFRRLNRLIACYSCMLKIRKCGYYGFSITSEKRKRFCTPAKTEKKMYIVHFSLKAIVAIRNSY